MITYWYEQEQIIDDQLNNDFLQCLKYVPLLVPLPSLVFFKKASAVYNDDKSYEFVNFASYFYGAVFVLALIVFSVYDAYMYWCFDKTKLFR